MGKNKNEKKAGTNNKMAGYGSDNERRPGNQWQIIGIKERKKKLQTKKTQKEKNMAGTSAIWQISKTQKSLDK